MSIRAVFILTSLALLAGAWWWTSPPADDRGRAGAGARAVDWVAASLSGRGREPQAAAAHRPLTLSDASGLTMDAARLFELGFAGRLVIDRDTRASIEALINTMPPEPSAQDMDRLQRMLRAGLPFAEAEKAYKLIADYRSYSRDVQRELLPMGIPNNQEEARVLYDRMDAVKRRYFDESTANALFGADERFARLVMEAGFVHQDVALTHEQKAQAIEALRARLPPDRRELIPPYEAAERAASQPAS